MSRAKTHTEGDPRGETAATRRWESVTYWPLTVAALVFIVTQTIHVVGDVRGDWAILTSSIITLTWAMFIVDYLVRLAMSKPRARWFRTHLFDLAVALLPVLRPVRLLGAFTRIASFTRTAASSLRSRMLIYGSGAALLLIWTASVTVLGFERDAPGATITGFGDAVWWAFCTVTTVGYGDYTPVTVPGRIVAVGLMMGGVVLVGLIVATFSSWVMERVTRDNPTSSRRRAATSITWKPSCAHARPPRTPPRPPEQRRPGSAHGWMRVSEGRLSLFRGARPGAPTSDRGPPCSENCSSVIWRRTAGCCWDCSCSSSHRRWRRCTCRG